MSALQFLNLSTTAGLHGMLGLFVGMRVRLTVKTLAPELVQEATGEVVDIAFHPEERFGDPSSSNIRPSDSHECWGRGWVKCDRLPLYVEVRWDGCSEDYTGLGKPGVWHLKPKFEEWYLPVDALATINHPGAPRAKTVKLGSKKDAKVKVFRYQIPLTHEDEMTFQNAQGKTIRGPAGEPKGFVVDLFRPPSMLDGEYFQHVYMILGRARKLEWELIRNFPRTPEGDPDWTVFERGPPEYLCEFLGVLNQKAQETWPRLLQCQRRLGMPDWDNIKPCAPDPEAPGKYAYDPIAWGFQRRSVVTSAPPNASANLSELGQASKRQRLTSELPQPLPAQPPMISHSPVAANPKREAVASVPTRAAPRSSLCAGNNK